MKKIALLFGALSLIGLGIYGYGMTVPSHTHHVSVEGPVGADAVGEQAVVADYESLSEEKQEVFDEARTTETSVETTAYHEEIDVVRYQGAYYRLDDGGVSTGNDVIYFGVGIVVIWIGGIGLAILGLYGIYHTLQRKRLLYWIGRKYQRLRY